MNPDKMSSKTTPEERAEKRLERLDKETAPISIDKYDSFATRGAYRNGYATCIREEVEPLESEVAKLRALVQELTIALRTEELLRRGYLYKDDGYTRLRSTAAIALLSAKSQGFTPTNTTDK